MIDRPVPALLAAARDVFSVLHDAGVRACLIGALAVQRWGQPRATADVDVSALAPYGDEAGALDALLRRFAPRQPNAKAFAIEYRVLLIASDQGVPIDVALAAFPFELEALDRASAWEPMPGIVLPTCSAEDLIVYKLVAARPQDLVDIEGIIRRQGHRLDVEPIRRWGQQFVELKEDPILMKPFEEAFRRIVPEA